MSASIRTTIDHRIRCGQSLGRSNIRAVYASKDATLITDVVSYLARHEGVDEAQLITALELGSMDIAVQLLAHAPPPDLVEFTRWLELPLAGAAWRRLRAITDVVSLRVRVEDDEVLLFNVGSVGDPAGPPHSSHPTCEPPHGIGRTLLQHLLHRGGCPADIAERVQWMVAAGVPSNAPGSGLNDALLLAAGCTDAATVRVLLDAAGWPPSQLPALVSVAARDNWASGGAIIRYLAACQGRSDAPLRSVLAAPEVHAALPLAAACGTDNWDAAAALLDADFNPDVGQPVPRPAIHRVAIIENLGPAWQALQRYDARRQQEEELFGNIKNAANTS